MLLGQRDRNRGANFLLCANDQQNPPANFLRNSRTQRRANRPHLLKQDRSTSAGARLGTLIHRLAYLCSGQGTDFSNEHNSCSGQSERRRSGRSQRRTASSELEYELPTRLLDCLEQPLGAGKFRRKLPDRRLQAGQRHQPIRCPA